MIALAAGDIGKHLACGHLIQQRLEMARGERGKPRPVDDPHADLVRDRGDAHEAAQLERLIEEAGGDWVDLSAELDFSATGLAAAHERTADAMREGTHLIFQATLFHDRWQGRADFLRRVEWPSDLGVWSYEVIDTKLARGVKPNFVHQLLLYSALVAQIQGRQPEAVHVLLGDGTVESLKIAEFGALHRHVCRALEGLTSAPGVETYPEPVDHCGICELGAECYARWVADDHLSLVAGAYRSRRETLAELGIETVAELAGAPTDLDPGPLGSQQFETLRWQAKLQVESRETGHPTRRCLKPERAAGLALLPDPSPGDIFFDLEGDPYVGLDGLEYLWGWWSREGGYEHRWAHGLDAEKEVLEAFIDGIIAAREAHQGMHVYHYAPHERSKLGSLAIRYGTREEAVDQLLREGVLVDLFAVVRQGIQVGEDSYSLKKLERHHEFDRRETTVREGGGSIVAYESWLESEDDEILESIRAYNEDDCVSTASLRDWLWETVRPEAAAEFEADFDDLRQPEPEDGFPAPSWLAEVIGLADRLGEGLGADPAADTPEQARRRLISHLLLFHRRECKPEWWRYFELRSIPVAELVQDRDAVADLTLDRGVSPVSFKSSLEWTYRFPPQEWKLDLGGVEDPTTGSGYNLVAAGPDFLRLRRGKNHPPPSPVALTGKQPIDAGVIRKRLIVLAESILAGEDRFAASRALIDRESPRIRRGRLSPDVEDLCEAAIGLDRSILPVQGPPGTGKTFRAARMVLAALAEGRRVAVTAQSHAAIKNLLHEIESCSQESGQTFSGAYKGYEYEGDAGLIDLVEDNGDIDGEHQLVAGTAWLLSRPEQREAFDLLFIDEASQYSLANAVAVSLAAESVVLLGDPQQLPQVTKASHPGDSGVAVLEHLLAGEDTIPEEKGVFLPVSWRMHPDVCGFVSERSYDSRLDSRDACSKRMIEAREGGLSGVGLRAVAVEHEGRSQQSPEEAQVIARACRDLLGGSTVTNEKGKTRSLGGDDILVVAPYNLAVRRIQGLVPDGVRVGTVDRFQGQEAPVVFYALTSSSGDDAPRGLDFLFNKNRLNVAVSRAQCLSILVYSPRLLDANCRTIESMRLLDGLCRYVEMAKPVELSP